MEQEVNAPMHLVRQWDIIPLSALGQRVHVIGCGAIGSHAAIALAKMGILNQVLWDFDPVSIENMSCQGYRFKDIGKPKVEALRDIIFDYSNQYVEMKNEKWDGQSLDGIVITAVDSMEVRQKIWAKCKNNPMVDYVIDPRMSAEYALMFTMNTLDEKDHTTYEKTLYTDGEAVQEPCTAKATIYTSGMISGLVVKAVKDIITRSEYPRITHWNIKLNSLQSWAKGG